MEPLKGRNVLITGADKGLGRIMALSFAAEGMNIGLIGRTKSNLEQVADEIKLHGVEISVVTADIFDIDQAYDAVKQVKKELGFIDTLINNAGTALFGDSPASKPPRRQRINVSTKGASYVIRAVLPEMIRKRRGDIVNITPATDVKGGPGTDAYTISKAELIRMSESLMQKVRKHNIRVTSLTPDIITANLAIELNLTNGKGKYDMEMWLKDITEEVLSQLKMDRCPAIEDAGLMSVVQC